MIDFNNLPCQDKIYYQDESVVIYCGDCRDILPYFEDKSFDLVLTSPPYDNLREYNGGEWDFETTARWLFQVLSVGGIIVWVVGDATIDGSETGSSFKQALYFKELGLNLHDTMIYQKSSPPLTHNRYEQHFEYMFVFSKDKPKTFNPILERKLWGDHRKVKAIRREKDGNNDFGFASQSKTKIRGNVWHYNIGGGHVTDFKPAYDHPAIFPEKLAEDHIVSWSNPGDVVLDPFLGSGTTCYCANKLGRKSIGIEISPDYCRIAVVRLRQGVMRL